MARRLITCAHCGGVNLPHYSRGICDTCWGECSRRGILDRYPRVTLTREEVIDAYLVMIRRTPEITNREIAERLGMRHKTLTRALARARGAGELTVWRENAGYIPFQGRPPRRRLSLQGVGA